MIFSEKQRYVLLLVLAALSCLAGLYHFVNLFYKMDASPTWRHLLFVGINLFCVVGFIKRPAYFVYFLALLLIQQYYSHGTYLVSLWHTTRTIHWISVFDLLLLPIGLVVLIEDRQEKKRKAL